MTDPLIGPGEDDYGRKPVEKFNPCLGSDATKLQMELLIVDRNARAIDNEISEFQRLRANPMKCPCGYDTIEFAICEVASVHLCPNCRKVHLIGPEDDVMDLVKEYHDAEADARAWLEAYHSVGAALGDGEPEAAGLDQFANDVKELKMKLATTEKERDNAIRRAVVAENRKPMYLIKESKPT